jgi:tRNA nucleotidyltransferase/poly(A) polymerase
MGKPTDKQRLFDFSALTRDSIMKNAPLIQYVAKERIKDELTKVFQKGNPF